MNASVGIIGIGWVGASVAISALHGGVANELLLSDVTPVSPQEKRGPFHGPPSIQRACSRASVGRDRPPMPWSSQGTRRQAWESRLDLLLDN